MLRVRYEDKKDAQTSANLQSFIKNNIQEQWHYIEIQQYFYTWR